jgi:hypothetical protein
MILRGGIYEEYNLYISFVSNKYKPFLFKRTISFGDKKTTYVIIFLLVNLE